MDNEGWEDHTPHTNDDQHAVLDEVYGDNWCQRLQQMCRREGTVSGTNH